MIEKKGPGGQPPTEANRISASHGKHATATLPVVYATLLLAMPGAAFDRLLVKRCVWCAYCHVHHLPVGAARVRPLLRSPRCAPHRRYSVEVTAVLPAAAVPGSRRRGAAA